MGYDTGIDIGIDMLSNGVGIIVVVAVIIILGFSVLLSNVLDVLADVIICCVSDSDVDVLTDMNVIVLTAPSEQGSIPSC